MKASLFKKVAKGGLILGASVFALAGAADAATTINLYGASAQTNFWNGAAAAMLQTLGCAAGAVTTVSPTDSKSKVTHATGCPDALSSDDGVHNGIINFSYSNKASFDGIEAADGIWDSANNGGGAQPCATGAMRSIATYNNATNAVSSTCQTVHIGTSDVDASSFLQLSNGAQFGPLAGPSTSRAFFDLSGNPGVDTSNIPATFTVGSTVYNQPQKPLAYPFGFYVNTGVTSTRCGTGAVTASKVNAFCLHDSDCGTGSPVGTCAAQTIDNLSRLQAVLLFGGSVKYWDDFGAYFKHSTPLPVTLCFRHAGSGTHATLDLGIMEGNGWGNGINVQNEQDAGAGSLPYVYYNDGTSDALNCLEWAGGQHFAGHADMSALDPTAVGGGIAYVDADNTPYAGGTAGTAPFGAYTGPIKYNGVAPSRVTMHDGLYDDFWTVNRMYVPAGLTPAQLTIYTTGILAYLNTPANITDATVGGTRGETYGAAVELNFPKTSDTGYITNYDPCSGANCANPN